MEENQNKQDVTSCPNCGKAISIQTEVCPYCDTEINKTPKNENVISKFINKTKENKMPIALFSIFLLIILIFGIYTFNLYGEYTSLRSDNQALNTKIVDLKDSNTRLQSKLAKANKDYDTLKSDYDELQNKLQNYSHNMIHCRLNVILFNNNWILRKQLKNRLLDNKNNKSLKINHTELYIGLRMESVIIQLPIVRL